MPSQTLIDQLQGMWPFNMGMPPSWLSQAQQQTQRDIAAYQQGGVPALMADTGTGQDLAGGFGGITKKVGAIPPFTPIRAYHGSPYDFDKFDLSKIGTGEGAQSYGHGLYFAENPAVAEQYRQAFKGGPVIVPGNPFSGAETVPRSANPRMYEVNINAKPEQFLDWDKPLSQQSGHVQDALFMRLLDQMPPKAAQETMDVMGRQTGDTIYRNIWRDVNRSYPEASAALQSEGIPGIRYLDQGSRNLANVKVEPSNLKAGEWMVSDPRGSSQYFDTKEAAERFANAGTSNYVVFNPDIVEIMKKYGLAGAMPFGIGAMPFGTGNEQQQ
jgi:hypothetical protein